MPRSRPGTPDTLPPFPGYQGDDLPDLDPDFPPPIRAMPTDPAPLLAMNAFAFAAHRTLTDHTQEQRDHADWAILHHANPARLRENYEKEQKRLHKLLTASINPSALQVEEVELPEPFFDADPDKDKFNAASKLLHQRYPRIKEPSPDIRHFIYDVIYQSQQKGLSETDVNNLIEGHLTGAMRDTFRSMGSKSTSKQRMIQFIRQYAKLEPSVDRQARFYAMTLPRTGGNTTEEMTKMFTAALAAFPEMGQDDFYRKLQGHVMSRLPDNVRKQMLQMERQKEQLRGEGVAQSPIEDWEEFRVNVIDLMDNKTSGVRKVEDELQELRTQINQVSHRPGPTNQSQESADMLYAIKQLQAEQANLQSALRQNWANQGQQAAAVAPAAWSRDTRPQVPQPTPQQTPQPAPQPRFQPTPQPRFQAPSFPQAAQGNVDSRPANNGGSQRRRNDENPLRLFHWDDPQIKEAASRMKANFSLYERENLKKPSTPSGILLPHKIQNGRYCAKTETFHGPIWRARDNEQSGFTKELHEWATYCCFRCGEDYCSALDPRCIYANDPDTYDYCTNCRRGFHQTETCKLNKKINPPKNLSWSY